jgi:hypothetical protein
MFDVTAPFDKTAVATDDYGMQQLNPYQYIWFRSKQYDPLSKVKFPSPTMQVQRTNSKHPEPGHYMELRDQVSLPARFTSRTLWIRR